LFQNQPQNGRKGKKMAFFENKKLESFWNLGFMNLWRTIQLRKKEV